MFDQCCMLKDVWQMKRKGWKPNEDDMNVIVAIHNSVRSVCIGILLWELKVARFLR